ncbi:MAG: T9SS type A sorting domain-containing protein [Flavobacteriales bacterium]|nr:T9SS type A sorting domain-containing protein [Flavobacteriales bacterium]
MMNATRLIAILLFPVLASAQITTELDNGVLSNSVTTPIEFSNGDPWVRSTATGTIPLLSTGATDIVFTVKGADGGTATWDGIFVDLMAKGGQGGTVTFQIPITVDNEGREFTFYQGKRGSSDIHDRIASGGGGASTAIVDHNGSLLCIAGGGGGGSAVETHQSHGLPGGGEYPSNGIDGCGDGGLGGDPYSTGGPALTLVNYIVNEYSNRLFIGAGGGGGYYGSVCQSSPDLHQCEIQGKTPAIGGAGGHHPEATYQYGNACDPLNPFGVGCTTVTTRDACRGGTGYSGGGAGGPFHSGITPYTECTMEFVGFYGGGGGGAGYEGGGGGGQEYGGGGGSSWVANEVLIYTYILGGTTSTNTNANNGSIGYRVIYDSQPPVAVCQSASVTLGVGQYFDENGNIVLASGIAGQATLLVSAVNGGSTDNTGIASISVSPSSFNCSNLGANTVTLTVTDYVGLTSTCQAQVTVVDDFAPTPTYASWNTISAPNFGVIDLTGNTQLTVIPPTLTFEDNCSVSSVVSEPFTVTCEDVGTNITRQVTATDQSGNQRVIDLEYTVVSSTPYYSLYVDPDATGTNTGLSWANAFTSLESALEISDCATEILVASGTYTPSASRLCSTCSGNLDHYFLLNDGIVLKGGYNPSTGLQDYSNPSILDGDLGGGQKVYSVVLSKSSTGTNVLDGFAIRNGSASGAGTDRMVDGVAFRRYNGGGVYSASGNLQIKNCVVSGNRSTNLGGGLHVTNTTCTITNALISGNVSASQGGGVMKGAGGSLTLVNTTIAGNYALGGGGIAGNFTSRNSVVWGNGASSFSPDAFGIITATYSLIKDETPTGTGNLDGTLSSNDPLFVNPITASSTPTTAGDYRVSSCPASVVIDAGSNALNATANDLDGNARIVDGDNIGMTTIDMGAFESSELPEVNASFSVSTCTDYTVPSGDETYTVSGVYSDTLTTICGADSILTITLTVLETVGVVSNTNDSGPGSLRDAVASTCDGDTIIFDASTNGNPIVLTSGDISFSNNLVIIGNGPDNTIIDGNASSRIFEITGTDSTILRNLTVQNGQATGSGTAAMGGGIFSSNTAKLILENVVINNNMADGFGGGLAFQGGVELRVSNSTIDGNSSGTNGGGIQASFGTGTSSVSLSSSTVSNNQATFNGGGMFINSGSVSTATVATVNIHTSTITGNAAGSNGGGIFSSVSSSNQTATQALTVTNSTLTDNSASSNGGGIYANTIASAGTTSNLNLQSSIVALNGSSNIYHSHSPTITSLGHNIFDDVSISGSTATDILGATDLQLNLGTLQNNGGLTFTMVPGCGSIAINSGNPADASDAQNVSLSDGRRDVGAAENQLQTTSTFSVTETVSYTVPSGNQTITNLGTQVVMDTIANVAGCDSVMAINVTILPIAISWLGVTSTDWNDATNWGSGLVPGLLDVASISSIPVNQPHITSLPASPVQCQSILLDAGAILTIDAGKALTVTGDIVNNGTILVKADATGIGSLITQGTISGSGASKMEQYLTGSGGATPNGVFYYVSSPVNGNYIYDYNVDTGDKLWTANETTQSYTLQTVGAVPMVPTVGYVARMGSTQTITFNEVDQNIHFNSGNLSASGLTRTGTTAANRGYNLVGNPYPSTVSWDNAVKTNLETTLWYRTHQGSTMLYDTYNASGMIGTNNNGGGAVDGSIPPTQAFWVRVSADGLTGQLDFANADRSHGTLAGIYKTEAQEGLVRIALSNETVSDEAIILFEVAAQDGFDDYDSHKYWSSNVPQLYMNLQEDTLVINGLYSSNTNPTVPLGMKLPAQGSYTINANDITVVGESIHLEDTYLNHFQDLNVEPNYSFNSAAGNIGDRFVLHFGMSVTGIDELTQYSRVYVSNHQLNIILPENVDNGNVQVLDLTGRVVAATAMNATRTVLDLSVNTGVYLVQIASLNGTETHRVFLN